MGGGGREKFYPVINDQSLTGGAPSDYSLCSNFFGQSERDSVVVVPGAGGTPIGITVHPVLIPHKGNRLHCLK